MKYTHYINKVSRGRLLFRSLLCLFTLLPFYSCSDWLDVKPESEEREKDLFTSYQGFKDALSGCYSTMVGTDLYGERLSMADVENLACLWNEPNETNLAAQYSLYHHNYTSSYGEDALKAIYGGLFNVVAQANKIIEHIGTDGNVINDPAARNVVTGEAYAIRAYCQFDLLRLFGQVPQNAQNQISLPYSFKTSISEQARYYGYADYCRLLEADLDSAENRLYDYDPACHYTMTQLNGQGSDPVDFDDDFMTMRRFRLNYYAVRALKARYYLYTGQTQKAYTEAKAVIDAKVNGSQAFYLSGMSDLGARDTDGRTVVSYGTLPHECIFALSNHNLADYAIDLLGGNASNNVSTGTMLYITTDMLDKQLYQGQNTASNNRYLYIWNHRTVDMFGTSYPTLTKYYYDANNYSTADRLSVLMTNIQLIPMLRLSEMYLIAMETTTDLAEANSLYKAYMESHNVNITTDYASLDEVRDEVVNEYRREFYGEGQMFYTYKRKGTTQMMFSADNMTESLYELPIPTSEYDSEK